jgi:hypothetical protein
MVEMDGDFVRAVTLENILSGEQVVVQAKYVLDATELGDLLELANVEHVIGSESQAQTGEPHALPGEPDPLDQQAVTWCFAVDYLEGEDFTIEKPEKYDQWREMKLGFLAWAAVGLGGYSIPETLDVRYRALFDSRPTASGVDVGPFWLYRRIFHKGLLPGGNVPKRYYAGQLAAERLLDRTAGGCAEEEKQQHLKGAKDLSLSLLYWMQTEAPRHDGGTGYPGLRLRGDITGGPNGLAKQVYVRESRRIKAQFTVLEQHVGVEARKELVGKVGAEIFQDSVGIGSYRIDLHPSTGRRNYIDISSYPFQIPLGALLPVRVRNLLPACKNLGTTHITNGCYRLHPVEWNIGEAAGALAAYCLEKGLEPGQVRTSGIHLRDFQARLVKLGVRLAWPEYARVTPR